MRKSDLWLNITQIMKVAGKTRNQRTGILRKIAKTTKIDVQLWLGQMFSWACYEASLELCQQLKVTEILKPLLDFGRKGQQIPQHKHHIQIPQHNYCLPSYVQINTGKTHVYMRRADFWINATHITNMTGRFRK